MDFLLFPEIDTSVPSSLPSDVTPSAINNTQTNPIPSCGPQTPASHPVRDGSLGEGSHTLRNSSVPANKSVVHRNHREEAPEKSAQSAGAQPEKSRNFMEALLGINEMTKRRETMKLKPLAIPKVEGGNVVVEIDDSEVCKSITELQFSVVGQLTLHKGELAPTIRRMRERLEHFWGFTHFRIVPRRNAVYHIILDGFDNQSKALSQGAVRINPGLIHFVRWVPGVNFSNRKVTSAQVWVRIFDLPMEYLINKQSLMDVAAGVGTPITIDQKTLDLELGIYVRFLVEVDLSRKLPDRILVKRLDDCKAVKDDFFVDVSYERLPYFCKECSCIGHSDEVCKKNTSRERVQPVGGGSLPTRNTVEDGEWTFVHKGRRGKQAIGQDDRRKGAETASHSQPKDNEDKDNSRQTSSNSNLQDAIPVKENENSVAADLNKENDSNEENSLTKSDKLIGTGCSNSEDKAVEEKEKGDMSGSSNCAEKQTSVEGQENSANPDNVEHSPVNAVTQSDTQRRMTSTKVTDSQSAESFGGNRFASLANLGASPSTKWGDNEEEGGDANSVSSSDSGSGELWEIEAQLGKLDKSKIYWIEEDEMYLHASGMCFDRKLNTFLKRIDPIRGDWRPIFYVRVNGEFTVAKNGNFGKSNKTYLEDKSWDRKALFSVNSPNYVCGLPKLFKDKVPELGGLSK